ncbi:MAG: ECF transporter S component [Clostridiales bacterium]|nr:ECF transporter S component [Clostridiales bacterium]
MEKNNNILWITRTALFLALLIIVQFVSKNLGQFVTGSLVNLVLVTAGLTAGISSGLTIAILSPFFAFILGVGPAFPQFLPVIAIGNAVIVLMVWLFTYKWSNSGLISNVLAIVIGATAKFLVLWMGIVKIILPMMTALKPAQMAKLGAAFSWSQLITALIGASIAFMIAPTLKKAMQKKG